MALTETLPPSVRPQMLGRISAAFGGLIERGVIPVIHTEPLKPRADTGLGLNDAYHQILENEAFRHINIPMADGSHIIIADTLPASPHTSIKNPAGKFVQQLASQGNDHRDTITGAYGEELPPHTLTWAFRENTEGKLEAVSFFDLAHLPDDDRQHVTVQFARSMAREARLLHSIMDSYDLGMPFYIMSSAAVGNYTLEERKITGLSRGSASNPTAHAHAVAFPDLEADTQELYHERRKIEIIPTDLLLKDADPFSRIFADAAREPMTEQLARVYEHAAVSSLDANKASASNDRFGYGWRVSFDDPIPLAEGLNTTITFLNDMQAVWEEGRKICNGTADQFSYDKVRRFAGDTGVAMLKLLKPTKHMDEKTNEEAESKLKKVEEILMRTNPRNVQKKLWLMLIADRFRDIPRFTLPGQPSFNFYFDFANLSGDGEIKGINVIPALSEKSVAENATGAIFERAEKRC